MRRKPYPEAFKKKLVQRMLMPGGPSASELATELGMSQPTLSRWLQAATTLDPVTKKRPKRPASKNQPRAPQQSDERGADEKLRMMLEAAALPEAELGEFLRRHGLHEADLAAWREAALSGLGGVRSVEPVPRYAGYAKRVRELEKELNRKDKALAETAALLVLQKKVRSIWADEDDDTKLENDD